MPASDSRGARLFALVLAATASSTLGALQACSSASHPKGETVEAGTDGARPDATSVKDASEGGAASDVTDRTDASPPVEASSDGAPSTAGDAADASDGADATVHDAPSDATVAPDATRPADGSLDAGGDASDGSVVCDPDASEPLDLSCTGLYSDWATKTIAPGLQTYTPAYILWSDGAVKTRWIYLPPGTQIDTTNMDDWVFPVGTKIWKQFALGGQLVETRLIWKQTPDVPNLPGWVYLDYRWSADLSSAPLLTAGETNVNGTTYEIPPTYRCANCHAGRRDVVLGFDLIGTGAAGAQGFTLSSLVAANLLTSPPPALPIVIPDDSTGLAVPALGWLHMNCGAPCHNHNTAAGASSYGPWMKLLAGQMYPDGGAGQVANLDTYTTTVSVMSKLAPNGHPYYMIDPGDAAASLLPLMDLTRGTDAAFEPMPPIVSHIPDTTDVQAVQNWINAL